MNGLGGYMVAVVVVRSGRMTKENINISPKHTLS
jgi:hypothetical protein